MRQDDPSLRYRTWLRDAVGASEGRGKGLGVGGGGEGGERVCGEKIGVGRWRWRRDG